MATSSMTRPLADQAAYMFPTSFAQQRLWFLDQLEPQSAAYNIPACLRLSFSLDIEAFQQSINALVERHEILRTTFVAVDGRPMQVITPTLTLPLPLVDLSPLPESAREAEALRLANEEVRHPFDLGQGPLLRTRVLKLAAQEYLLLLTLHHIISDEWSMGVLYEELATLYEACSSGRPSPLPDLPIQYVDFALWQQEWLQGEMLADHLAYWRQHLAGAPALLELPTDRPRPALPTSQGSIHFVTLPRSLSEALKALSRQEGVSLYMTLVTAFQVLLSRYTGQDDMLIGTVTAGRTQAELEALIGFFANTLVLRTDLSGNPPFREALARVREVIFDAYAHQEVPFDYLVKELQPERNLGLNPFFQVLLTLNPPSSSLSPGWVFAPVVIKTNTSKFDLSLGINDQPWGLVCRFEYSTDLFDASTIARMAGHWQALLEGIVNDPTQPMGKLPLLTEVERHQLLMEWNDTITDYPRNRCVHQLFEAQVERTPGAVAVVFEDQQLTYRELNRRANQLAHSLRKLGVGPEVLVGLCVERSLEMVVGVLGILKAGGAYVPLDPTYPIERLAFMLEDAQAPILVTQQFLATQLPTYDIKVICLDANEAGLGQQSEANPLTPTTSENLAYVIYTSGSTGRPKGVQILHRAVVNFLLSMRLQPGLAAAHTLHAVTTFSFDIAALELFLPLIVGARLIVASREAVVDGTALAQALARTHTTVMQATPATWRMLLTAGWQGDQRLQILCGGEALSLELAQQLLPKATSLWNLYGPTETTIWSSVCKIEPGDAMVSIGHPIANTQLYVLDTQLQPVPIGVPGELYIGGDGLARGYLNRPELTAERFIPHPFSDELDARLYKTGDLARYRADGTIEVIGRLDQQVKLRGFRIELGEIEAVLGHHSAVRQAVVVVREDVAGDKCLVAYVVPQQSQTARGSDLRSHVMKHLPAYMVPSAFVLVETLPLTPNGKLDRCALPAPELTGQMMAETFVAPTRMEHSQLLRIWEDLLEARPIGIRDNFFDLGGHSLLAARLVHRIEQVFGKTLPLSTLFARPTIEQLAAALEQPEEVIAGSQSAVVPVQTGGSRQPFFFLHGDYRGGGFYCFPLARALGADQPFYTLEPYRFDGLRVPPTFEAMAAAHLKSLCTVQAEGPYLLGGFCSGGLLAYEMARQLRAQGHRVDLLNLIDPTPVAYRRWARALIHRGGTLMRLNQEKQCYAFLWLRHAQRYMQHVCRYLRFPHYRQLAIKLVPERTTQNEAVISTLKERYELWLNEGAAHWESEATSEAGRRRNHRGFALPSFVAMFPEALLPSAHDLCQDQEGLFHWVAAEYEPNLYSGKGTFFFSWDSTVPFHKKWRNVTGVKDEEVEMFFIAGTHETCKTIHLHDLAGRLRACLDKAQVVKVNGETRR